MRERYEPAALTAAVTGGDVLPSQSPYIPKGAEEIVVEALAAAEAGATCVHLHARESDGRPSSSAALFEEIASGVRERSDVVVNISTGGAPGMTVEQRLEGISAARPELASLNLGTMNYEGFPTPARWPQVETDWERGVLEQAGSGVFTNTLAMIREFASSMRDLSVTPEIEVYDLGHLATARFLLEEGTLKPPLRVQLVLGILGGAGNELDDLFLLQAAAQRILGDGLGALGVAAVGYPMEFRHAAVALSCGMDCRVGLEDNLRVRRDRQAESNAELVSAGIQLAELIGRPIATPDQLRAELGPWGVASDARTK